MIILYSLLSHTQEPEQRSSFLFPFGFVEHSNESIHVLTKNREKSFS